MAVCKKCENLVNGNLTKENSCQEKWILNTLLKGTPKNQILRVLQLVLHKHHLEVIRRERERGLFNSDRMHVQTGSDNTTVHPEDFT